MFPTLIIFASVVTIGGLSAQVTHGNQTSSLANNDKERIEVVLNQYFDPFSITPTLDHTSLASVTPVGFVGGAGGPTSSSQQTLYTVKSGDTLSGIADQYNMSSGSLVLSNPDLQNTELIHAGQILVIPSQPASDSDLAKERADRQKKLAQATANVSQASYQSVAASGDSSYALPVHYSYESQGFTLGVHNGIDMVAPYGSTVRATKAGCIISATYGWNGGYGTLVVEDLGGGVTARYAHLSDFETGVKSGVCVDQGDVLGYVGTTGNSTGPHLHFELRLNDTPFNPHL